MAHDFPENHFEWLLICQLLTQFTIFALTVQSPKVWVVLQYLHELALNCDPKFGFRQAVPTIYCQRFETGNINFATVQNDRERFS